MAFNTFCFAAFCVNLMIINPNLYDLGVKHEYLQYGLNTTLNNYKSLENSLESNVHIAIEVSMYGLISNATKEALVLVKGLLEEGKSQGKDVAECADAFQKMIMLAAEGIVDNLGSCLSDIEKKYNDLAYDIETGIKNTNELISIVKVLGLDCNGLEDDVEYECFKTQLETYLDKHYYLGQRYLKHVEKHRVALAEAKKATKCIEGYRQDASHIVEYVLREIEGCIKHM